MATDETLKTSERRDLDTEVAEQIMGWHWVGVDWLGNPVPEPVLVPPHYTSAVPTTIPDYSTSYETASQVWGWMESMLPEIGAANPFISLVSSHGGRFTCAVAYLQPEQGGGALAVGTSDTAPKAICECGLELRKILEAGGRVQNFVPAPE